MAHPAEAFIAAQRAALRGSADLVQLMGGKANVFVEVPPNAPLPYVVIGQDEIADDSDECGEAYSIVSTVQWWAIDKDGTKGSLMVRRMGAAIIAALKTPLAITGQNTVMAEMEQAERYATDPDQSSRGLVALRYETTAT